MNKKNDLKILKFPNSIVQIEKQVEAILFAAEEPLDIESIQEKLNTRANISKILDSLEKQYKNKFLQDLKKQIHLKNLVYLEFFQLLLN